MAGGQERILKRRIKSVRATKKITKAMELIAASRIVKAISRINDGRPYMAAMTKVVEDLAASSGLAKSIYLDDPKPGTRALLVITADRGLCGSFNSAPLRFVERSLVDAQKLGGTIEIVAVGKKAKGFFNYRTIAMVDALTGVTDRPTFEHARQIAKVVFDLYDNGTVTTVDVVTTRFYSAGSQKLEVVPLLPIDPAKFIRAGAGPSLDFEVEPSPEEIINPLLRLYVEEIIFALLLEASAAEHAYRQRAMKSATENAEELATKYTRIMNRARQDAITTEIMEIVGGAEALRSAGDNYELD